MQLCQVCDKQKSKYKCPQCSIPYCSLPCFKEHKESNLNDKSQSLCSSLAKQMKNFTPKKTVQVEVNYEGEQNELVKSNYIQDESLRLSEEQLAKLAKNQNLIKMLGSPGMRQKILEIDNSRMRLNLLQKALLDEQFMKFADQALKTVGKLSNR